MLHNVNGLAKFIMGLVPANGRLATLDQSFYQVTRTKNGGTRSRLPDGTAERGPQRGRPVHIMLKL